MRRGPKRSARSVAAGAGWTVVCAALAVVLVVTLTPARGDAACGVVSSSNSSGKRATVLQSGSVANTDGLTPAAADGVLSDWTTVAENGQVQAQRVAVTDAPAGLTSALELRTTSDPGRWAFALGRLSNPRTFFTVGQTYRAEVFVRNLNEGDQSIGLLISNGNFSGRPASAAQYTSGVVRDWRLVARTFVVTAPAGPDTGLYLALPTGAPSAWQVAGMSVRQVLGSSVARTDAPADQQIGYASGEGKAPDSCAWTLETGGNGWGNGELQTYTASSRNTVVQPDGRLRITVRREDLRGDDGVEREFTSGRMTTLGKVEIPSGSYVEASIVAPVGDGMWPAFWLIGSNFSSVGWPASGEIDIFEGRGDDPRAARNAVHTATFDDPSEHVQSGWGAPGGTIELLDSVDSRPHTYGVYFDGAVVRFYVDRVEVRSVLAEDAAAAGWSWPFDDPVAVTLNVAVAGGTDSSTARLPQSMLVSPLRVWHGVVPR